MIIKFHFIVVHYGEGKKYCIRQKGAFRKWILCTKRKDRQKDISFDKQTRRRHHHHRRPTQHTPQPTSNLLCQKKYNQLIQTKHSITCLTS